MKTNLLFDALLAPNIEVEVPFGKHWSLMAESVFPWWVDKNNTWCYELLSGSVELRRWLGNKTSGRYRKPLTGHFIGLFAGGGKYDFERKGKGYQGEFFVAPGLSYGFAHSIGNRLNMEYSVGFGYMRTRYRHYHQSDIDNSVLLWQNNGRSTYIGPTKLKVSLVWLIGNYKGGRL